MPRAAKMRKRSLYWNFIWFLILFFILASIFGLIASMPIWQIKQVQVEGSQLLAADDIIKIAAVPMGENIFFVGFGKPVRRVQDIIQIKAVNIYRRFPDTIVINIKERVPFAATVVDQNPMIVDADGVVIWSAKPLPSAGKKINFMIDTSGFPKLPMVTGLLAKDLKENYKLTPESFRAVSGAFTMLQKFMPASKLGFEMKGLGEIDLLIDDVLRIKIGDSKDIDKKVETFKVLISSLQNKLGNIEYVDVRLPNDPVVKFKN